MIFKIEISKSAKKALRQITKDERSKISQRIDSLTRNPRPIGYEKLKGEEDLYRIRSGDYRIIYNIKDKILCILILKIGHRKDVYK
jgi:mRNA interferase RelE/StbE